MYHKVTKMLEIEKYGKKPYLTIHKKAPPKRGL